MASVELPENQGMDQWRLANESFARFDPQVNSEARPALSQGCE
jgi:hypothetical protein